MNTDINKFIANVLGRDYSKANQMLESIIQDKLSKRIKESAKVITTNEFLKTKKQQKNNK